MTYKNKTRQKRHDKNITNNAKYNIQKQDNTAQVFPIIYEYFGPYGIHGPVRKAIVAINSELIRANKTKRKLTECRTECALLRLELLEAKKKINHKS